MKKLFIAPALAAVISLANPFPKVTFDVGSSQALACTTKGRAHDPCGPVPNTRYGGGGYQPKTIKVRVCLSDSLYTALIRRDGVVWWDFGLYYGTGRPEEVATVRGQCRNQNIRVGDKAVAYITCPGTYVGWVAVKIRKGDDRKEQVTLQPYQLPAKHDPIR